MISPQRLFFSFILVWFLSIDFVSSETCVDSSTVSFTTSDRVLVNGQRIDIKGLSWYGLEGSSYCPEGLDQVTLEHILDFVANNGFNLLRIPFSTDFVLNYQNRYPSSINTGINPSLQGLNSMQVLDHIFAAAASRGILILLDMHWFDPSQYNDQPALWYSMTCHYDSRGFCVSVTPSCVNNRDGVCVSYTEQVNMNAWNTIVGRYKSYWNFIGADIQNEMHEPAMWGANGTQYDYASAAERFADSIFTNNPSFNGLIFVEGIGNTPLYPYCEDHTATGQAGGHWWGGNLEAVRCRQLNFAGGKTNRLVYSPHEYGPSVYDQAYFESSSFPGNMPAIWDDHFGFVRTTTNKAVVIGEWGGPQSGKTNVWLNEFVKYLQQHDIRDNIHWSLNPNRNGDTPGVLIDWNTPDSNKLNLLAQLQPSPTRFSVSGSQVCYASASTTGSASSSIATTTTGKAVTSTAAITTTTTTTTSSTSSTSSTTGSSGSGGVSITQTVVSSWIDNGSPQVQVNVVVKNTGSSPLSALSMRLGVTPSQYWTASKNSDGTYGLTSWASPLAPGASFTWGYIAAGTGPASLEVVGPTSQSSSTSTTTGGKSTTTTGAKSTTTSTTASSTTASSSSSSSASSGEDMCALSMTQTVSNRWTQGGQDYVQVNVIFTNRSSGTLNNLVISLSIAPTAIWSLSNAPQGRYTWPSWQTSLAPGATLSWGYQVPSANPAQINIFKPSGC